MMNFENGAGELFNNVHKKFSKIPKEKQRKYSQKIDQSNNSKGLATLEYFERKEMKNANIPKKSIKITKILI